MVSFSAAFGGLLFGYEIGVVSQVLGMEGFLQYFGCFGDDDYTKALRSDFEGNVTFTFLAGCIVGALFVSWLADKIGRKWSILFGSMLFTAGGFFQCLANGFGTFYAGRIISGMGIGVLSAVVPLIISECAPSEERGRMITIQQLMITIGILVAAICNAIIISFTSGDFEWRLALSIQIIPGFILFLLTLFMPYSPRWLADQDRDSEAIQTLAKLRDAPVSSEVVQDEFHDIKSNIEYEREVGTASWSELLRPGIINRVFIAVILQFFQQWTGINVILYYQQSLLEGMGFHKDIVAIPLTIANDFINFISTFPGMYLVEKLGRRSLLIYGGFGMGLSLYMVCLFTGLAQAGTVSGLFAVVSVYFFIVFFSSTWGPVVWVYQSEIFPQRVRAKATGMATVSNWTWNAVIAKITPLIRDRIGFYMYLIFGSMGLLMGLFTWAFVPETMGKSLEDMDALFGSTDALLQDTPRKHAEKA